MNVKQIIKSSPAFIVPSIINLVSLVVFTRILPLELYGQLSLALITIEFFQGLFYQWIKSGMMRFYKSENNFSSIPIGMQFNIAVTLVISIATFVIFLLEHFHLFEIGNFITIVLAGSVWRGFGNFILDYIRIENNKNISQYTLVSLMTNVSYYVPALAFALIRVNATVTNILTIQVTGIMIFLVVYSVFNRRMFRNISKFYGWLSYKEFATYGYPLIFVFLTANIFVRIDRYIIEYNLGLKAVGAYSAAFSLSNLAITSFFTILTLPTYPEILRKLNEGDFTSAKSIYDRNGNLILMVAVPLVFMAALLNHPLCLIFFGKTNGAEVEKIFPYVVFGLFLYNYKAHYFDQIFQFGQKTKILMMLGILLGITHLIGAFFLSKIWGATGVAISSIVLNSMAIIFIFYYSQKIFPITLNKKICISLFVGGLGIYLSYSIFSIYILGIR